MPPIDVLVITDVVDQRRRIRQAINRANLGCLASIPVTEVELFDLETNWRRSGRRAQVLVLYVFPGVAWARALSEELLDEKALVLACASSQEEEDVECESYKLERIQRFFVEEEFEVRLLPDPVKQVPKVLAFYLKRAGKIV